MMIQFPCIWPWISLESLLDINILAATFLPRILPISSCDHSVLILWLELPKFFLINIVDLFFGRDTVPEEVVINLLIILIQIVVGPNHMN